ncbi:general amino acid permease agp2 [Colletotrichum incanum]|nr:general amino acid permease agp2 [Colletotrichum incanum]
MRLPSIISELKPSATRIKFKTDKKTNVRSSEIIDNLAILQRHLTSRQVQFITIGGLIRTAFLLIAFNLHALVITQINNSLAEMAVFIPISAASIHHAGAWVDTGGKILLIGVLFLFTFITKVRGNPQRDAYGFRNWSNPADFTIVGPHYLAKVAGETQNSRKTMKAAFKSVDWRFGYFFIGGALCVDIILPANNQMLRNLLSSGETGTGAASSFEIAMKNMNVGENAYVYCSSCSLYGVALNGHAPKFLSKCTKEGLPIYCLFVALAFAFLSFLKLGSNSVIVLTCPFVSNYTMAFVAIFLFCRRKITRRGQFVKPEDADLVWIRPAVDEHEAAMAINENEVGLLRRLVQMARMNLKLGRSLRSSWV